MRRVWPSSLYPDKIQMLPDILIAKPDYCINQLAIEVTYSEFSVLNGGLVSFPTEIDTVVYRDSVYRFNSLYRFRALNAGDEAWSHHKCSISI